MHIVLANFNFYFDYSLWLSHLSLDGEELSADSLGLDADIAELFEENGNFSPLDHLDFWDKLVEAILAKVSNDALISFEISGLPGLDEYFFGIDEEEGREDLGEDVFDKRESELYDLLHLKAELGCGYAQKLMGDYCFGNEEQTVIAAETWYRKAAKHGLAGYLAEFGMFYHEPWANYAEAASCYLEALEYGDRKAQVLLAKLYLNGLGVDKDERKALALAENVVQFPFSCQTYNAIAALACGQCYESGANGNADPKKAFEFYQIAYNESSARSNTSASYALARCYEFGIGTEKNDLMALKYYHEAIKYDSTDALYALGRCYENGIGAKVDAVRAASFYKKAANQGNLAAMEALARCCENGIGVERDEKQAVKWRERAEAQCQKGAETL